MKFFTLRTVGIALLAATAIGCSDATTPTSSSDTPTPSEAELARGGSPSSCLITSVESIPYVYYNEADCTVTFSWTLGPGSDPCRAEVFWGPDTAECWSSPPAGLPNHDVRSVYTTYEQTITINVAGLPWKKIRYRCRSMSESGLCWLNLPYNEQGLAYCGVVVIDSDCEPVIPCEYPCN